MKKGIAIRTASAVLAAVLLLCPLSVCFADDELVMPDMPDPEMLWHEAGCEMVWLLLRAWGIDIEYGVTHDDVYEFTDEVYDLVTDLVLQYLEYMPSLGSIISWTQLWAWGSDFWGNMRYNSNMLEDVQDFADWLVTTFNLIDNDTNILDAHYSVNGYPLYEYDQFYEIVDAYGVPHNRYEAVEIHPDSSNYYTPVGYLIIQKRGETTFNTLHICSYVSGTRKLGYTWKYIENDTISNAGGGYTGNLATSNYLYYGTSPTWPSGYRPRGELVIYDTSIGDWLSNKTIEFDGNTKIITSVINLPADDPSYTTGDGVTIVDGNPEYSQVEVINPISVSNLPAVVSTGSIRNPGLSDVFLPLKGFINTFSDGFGLMTQIVYNLPSPVVGMALAIMSAIAVFGVIRILKEH